MTNHQLQEVALLTEAIANFSFSEQLFFEKLSNQYIGNTPGVPENFAEPEADYVLEHKKFKMLGADPNFLLTQQTLTGLAPFLKSNYFAASGSSVAKVTATKVVEQEVTKEKDKWNLKLESFNSADKLKVIKEVRTLFGLGLKEAKDLVDGAPAVLKKDLFKTEALDLKAKLEAVGGVAVLE